MIIRWIRPSSAVASMAIALVAATASADVTRDQCIQSNGDAQSLRRDGKFDEARKQLSLCGDPKCPHMVAADCIKRLDELEAAQPTIVFDVKDGAGADIGAVKVSVDGRLLVEKLDGTAFSLDPGSHTFLFEAAGQPPVTQTFVLTEGQKARHERVTIGGPPPAPAATASDPSVATPLVPPPAMASPGPGPLRTVGIGLGVAGVAAVGAGVVFGLLARSKWNAQQSACSSPANCPDHAGAVSDHATMTTDGTVSTVAFVAGGALVAAGAVLFLVPKRPAAPEPVTAVFVSPGVGPHAASLALHGQF